MKAYCVRCKKKQDMTNEKAGPTKRKGVSMVRGVCPKCGCNMCVFIKA